MTRSPQDTPATAKSWTLAEIEQFRASVRNHRLFACWLLSCYGPRRSEVLAIRWSALAGDTLSIRRSRVAVGKDTIESMPKSRRSMRDLPLPAELSTALSELKTTQQDEARAFGTPWSDERLIDTYAKTAPPFAMSGTPTNFSAYANVPAYGASTSRVYPIPASASCWPAGHRSTSSPPGMATTPRYHCRSTPMPNAKIYAPPARPSSADAWPTNAPLGHSWDSGPQLVTTGKRRNPFRR